MLILDNDDVEKLLDIDSCIDSHSACAYRALAEGWRSTARTQTYVSRPNLIVHYENHGRAIPGTGMMALRLTSDIISDRG